MKKENNTLQRRVEMSEMHPITALSQSSISGPHWTSTKFSKNILMDALVKHILGLMLYGMSDLGEVLEVVGQLKASDEESWINAWGAMAQRLQDRAEKAERTDKRVTASTAYLRASTYWRASLMYFSYPNDSRISDYAHASSKCYERYLELSGYPGQYVKIPYENSFLPGHFYRSPVAGDNAPLLIITPGRDTWAEDTRWVYDGAIRRGIHCLVYDGPGQGFALRLNNLHFRHDWENVVRPVVDFALKIPGIDPSRIGLMGLSFGGFLAPRAAAFEKRIKVCIADPGNLSWGDSIIGALQTICNLQPHEIPSEMNNLVRDYAWKHGVSDSVKDVIQALRAYDNTSVADKIECETLVMDGTEEIAKGQARKFFDALKCPKHYMLFDEATTAQSHCQIGAYSTATEYLFDWLDERL
jgi:hypothetical protein